MELRGGKVLLMVTNFSQEFEHRNKGTKIASIEVKVVNSTLVVADSVEPSTMIHAAEPAFDINPTLPRHQQT